MTETAQPKHKRFYGLVSKEGRFANAGVLGQYSTKEESKQLTDRFAEAYGQAGLIEPLYNPEALARLLEMNTYHYRACKTKARDTAGLGWELEAVGDDASAANNATVTQFFESLSPPLVISLDRAQLDYEAVGWGAIELVRVNYAAEGLLALIAHVPAHTLRIHQDGNRYCQIRGAKRRWFRAAGAQIDVDQNTGSVHPLGSLEPDKRATEILAWVNYTPRSDFYGLPDIMPGLGALHGDLARRDFNISFFDNFGVPAYAVFITGDYDEGELDEDGQSDFEKAIEQHFRDLAKNPHSVFVLSIPTRANGQEVKVEFKPLAVDIKEASFRLYRQDNRDEILAAHGVPPYRAGIAETGSLGGSTAKEATEIYKISVIEPRQTVLEDLIDRYILQGAFEVADWRFKLADIDNADELHDANLLNILVAAGAAWPDEMRAHFATRFGLDMKRALPGTGEPTRLAPVSADDDDSEGEEAA